MTEGQQTDPDDVSQSTEGTDQKNGRESDEREKTADDVREPEENGNDTDVTGDKDPNSQGYNEPDTEITASSPQKKSNRYMIDLEGEDPRIVNGPAGGNRDSVDEDTTARDNGLSPKEDRLPGDNTANRFDNGPGGKEEQRENTDGEVPDPETYAAIHRSLGDAGIRLNEAHSHLSSLRSVGDVESEAGREVARAEIEALVETLAETQEQLNRALSQASATADTLNVEVPIEDSVPQSADEQVPEMLWNTVRR